MMERTPVLTGSYGGGDSDAIYAALLASSTGFWQARRRNDARAAAMSVGLTPQPCSSRKRCAFCAKVVGRLVVATVGALDAKRQVKPPDRRTERIDQPSAVKRRRPRRRLPRSPRKRRRTRRTIRGGRARVGRRGRPGSRLRRSSSWPAATAWRSVCLSGHDSAPRARE
jgi:hypothetical protein